jgi:hypothetical protein
MRDFGHGLGDESRRHIAGASIGATPSLGLAPSRLGPDPAAPSAASILSKGRLIAWRQ